MVGLFKQSQIELDYSYKDFDTIRDLIKEFLLDYPRNKISVSYFKSMLTFSDIAGICCTSSNPQDAALLDDLHGYIDIPAGMEGLVCDIIRKSPSMVYLMIYNPKNINPQSVKSLRFTSDGLGKIF